jgi:plasmid maintenance system antidote protein VapI
MRTPKKKTTKKKIAIMANIGPDFFSHILRGRRRCPPLVAVRLEEVTGINRSVWVWESPEEIRKNVEQFIYSK